MRQLLLVAGLLITASLHSQTYLDMEGNPQTYQEHRAQWPSGMLSMEVARDTFAYVARETRGQISNVEKVYALLSKASGTTISSEDIIVVLYQNGGDEGYDHMNRWEIKKFFKRALKEQSLLDAKIFHLCPNPGALGRLTKRANWLQDPGGFFGRNFFKYKASLSSFLVIGPNGDYICILGEHTNAEIANAVEIIKQEGE